MGMSRWTMTCSKSRRRKIATAVGLLLNRMLTLVHLVGWHVEPAALNSRRVEGAAVVAMPKVKRAAPLPPGFLTHLELRGADVSLGVELRYRLCLIIFMVLSRSRFGDAMRIGAEPRIVNEYLETEVTSPALPFMSFIQWLVEWVGSASSG
eukprot:6475249-Amphidinium_carterae.1